MKDTVTQVVARIIGTGAIVASVPRSTDDRVLWVLIGLILFLAWVAEPLDRLVARQNPDGLGAEAVATGRTRVLERRRYSLPRHFSLWLYSCAFASGCSGGADVVSTLEAGIPYGTGSSANLSGKAG